MLLCISHLCKYLWTDQKNPGIWYHQASRASWLSDQALYDRSTQLKQRADEEIAKRQGEVISPHIIVISTRNDVLQILYKFSHKPLVHCRENCSVLLLLCNKYNEINIRYIYKEEATFPPFSVTVCGDEGQQGTTVKQWSLKPKVGNRCFPT